MSGPGAANSSVTYAPIGVIHTSHTEAERVPIQPIFAKDCPGQVEVFPEYAEGLRDLDAFTHVILIYHFHKAGTPLLKVQPYTDDTPRGVFATRHPRRPNPIGFSVTRLERVEGNTVFVKGADILDGTPLLDIKPYVPRFDQVENARGGWTETVDDDTARRRGRRGFRGGDAT